jgi:hypothetical protein
MTNVVKGMDVAMKSMDLEKVSEPCENAADNPRNEEKKE